MLCEIISYGGKHALHVGVTALSRRDLEIQLFDPESAQIGLDDLALQIDPQDAAALKRIAGLADATKAAEAAAATAAKWPPLNAAARG